MVFAICHEVGNLLAAMRLHGELLDPGFGPPDRRALGALGFVALAGFARCWTSRPSSPWRSSRGRLLAGLRSGLDDPQDPRLELDPGDATDLPALLADGEVLHHLLLCEVLAAFEQLDSGERLRMVLLQEGDHLVFELSGGVPEPEPAAADRLRAARSATRWPATSSREAAAPCTRLPETAANSSGSKSPSPEPSAAGSPPWGLRVARSDPKLRPR